MPKSKKNLQEEDLKDIVEEDTKAQEEPKEEPKEDVKETKEDVKPESHEDVEALKAEIAALKTEVSTQTEKMSQEMVGKLSTAFGLNKEEKVDDTPWGKENRQPTWQEALDYTAEKTHEKIKNDLAEVEKAEKEQAKTQEETQKNFTQNINKYWDTQIEELTKAGKIPAVKDDKDEKDEGKQFRVELFKTMMEVNQDRQTKGLDAISNLKEIFYEHFKAPNEQPAGYNAPVAGAVHGGASKTEEKVPYQEFHHQNIEDIVRGS